MSDSSPTTPWQFVCGWYSVDQVYRGLRSRIETGECPSDITSREFSEWLTDQYRLAMKKGIDIGQSGNWGIQSLAEIAKDAQQPAKEDES